MFRPRLPLAPALVLLLALRVGVAPAAAQDSTPTTAAFAEELSVPELRAMRWGLAGYRLWIWTSAIPVPPVLVESRPREST